MELPELQRNLSRFEELNAQVLGISVDSVYSHKAFADQLGGIIFPLLADFHPKGEVTKKYGLWREERGNGRRAIIIVDRAGIVRFSQVIPKGPPNVEEVLAAVKAIA
ncbi:MAG: redoxin domain-containing protein [Chloroflexi bacterium]|nr:redoxin domain-containing protein [Chloroflexota bacterium]MBI3762372.1 redoxin domain-containing protein [Chloroflexota bacterium]